MLPALMADSESSSTSVPDESDQKMSGLGRKNKINAEADVGGNRAGRRYAGYGEGIVLRPYTPHVTPLSSSYSDLGQDRSLPYYEVPGRIQIQAEGRGRIV